MSLRDSTSQLPEQNVIDDEKIRQFLRQSNNGKGATALQISKHINGPKGVKQQVNSILYRMQTEGQLTSFRSGDSVCPIWKLQSDSDSNI